MDGGRLAEQSGVGRRELRLWSRMLSQSVRGSAMKDAWPPHSTQGLAEIQTHKDIDTCAEILQQAYSMCRDIIKYTGQPHGYQILLLLLLVQFSIVTGCKQTSRLAKHIRKRKQTKLFVLNIYHSFQPPYFHIGVTCSEGLLETFQFYLQINLF